MLKNQAFAFVIFFFVCFIAQEVKGQTNYVLIDFGGATSSQPWNNVLNSQTGHVASLKDIYNRSKNMSIAVVDSFRGVNSSGTQQANPNLGIPSTASGDSFFGNDVLFNGSTQPTAALELSNLDTSKLYTLNIFGSRLASDNRETKYKCSGKSVDSSYLNVSNNTDSIRTFSLYPSAQGKILIELSKGPNNNNSFGFYYIGALQIGFQDSLPPPAIELRAPNGGEFWQTGKQVQIVWQNTLNLPSVLSYSANNGNSWSIIDTVPANLQSYAWTVPNMASQQALVKISSGALKDSSKASFEISSSTETCNLVVIGSSTAAGSGASSPDSAWVNRYRNYFQQYDTRIVVTNLARGGYTTFHILPDSNTLAANVGITTDSTRNISKALSFNPQGVIVNMPSNDAGRNFSPAMQMQNFRIMQAEAHSQGVRFWVCTTQPRNFNNASQIQIQRETRDSISTYFGSYSLDFWNGIADTNGHILAQFDSGDGVHLNDAGHAHLFQQVQQKGVADSLCLPLSTHTIELKDFEKNTIDYFPNPSLGSLTVEFNSQLSHAIISIYAIDGKLISSNNYKNKKNFSVQLGDKKGMYLIKIASQNEVHILKVLKY